MSNKDSRSKKALKFIRGLPPVNVPVRFLVKKRVEFGRRIFNFFSVHWPVTGIIKFKLPDGETVKLFSKADDYISTQAFWKGYMGYEEPSIRLFYYMAKHCPVIIDIGAYTGYFTLIGASSNSSAKVYSFEPVKKIFERLQKNITLNSLPNIIAENCAAGDSDAPVKFYLPDTNGLSFAGSTKKGWADDANEITVPSVSLDTYKIKKSIAAVNLVKMDCEFHEKEVLEGMRSILKEDKPVIIMEVLFPEGEGQKGHFEMETYKDIERIMGQHNYFFYLIGAMGLIRLEKLEYNPDERNYLFSTKRTEKVYNSYNDMETIIKSIL